MNAPTTLDRFWHYRDNKFWQFKSTSSDGYSDTSNEYKYYLTVSNGNFTDNHVTSPSIENSSLPLIYIFTEDTGESNTIYVKVNGSWIAATEVGFFNRMSLLFLIHQQITKKGTKKGGVSSK